MEENDGAGVALTVENMAKHIQQVLEGVDAEMRDSVSAHIGRQMVRIFQEIEKSLLQPGYGGLLEIPTGMAQSVVDVWINCLQSLGRPPKTFICRMLEDGSLFLKAVELPPGVVIYQGSKEKQGEQPTDLQPYQVKRTPVRRSPKAVPTGVQNSLQPIVDPEQLGVSGGLEFPDVGMQMDQPSGEETTLVHEVENSTLPPRRPIRTLTLGAGGEMVVKKPDGA